jgi:acetylornithine/N-succinyldiaminopimelate aminotransferase
MIGAVLAEAYKGRAGDILDAAAAHGLLILQAGPDVLRFVPPLNITDEELTEGLTRLEATLTSFASNAAAA